MEKILSVLMVMLFVANYLYISYGIVFKKGDHNVITWVLWAVFDIIALYGTIKNKEDFTLTLTFVLGTGLVTLVLLFKGVVRWTWVETLTIILVGICIFLTQVAAPNIIINATAIGLTVAGFPYLFTDIFKRFSFPKNEIISAWIFMAGSLCGTLATLLRGELVTIPLLAFLYWILILLVIQYRRRLAY
jgi:hypothetical protein